MVEERRSPNELAAAVLDGDAVDWDAAEALSAEAVRGLIPQLRLVARIAEAHRKESAASPGLAAPLVSWGHLRIIERIGAGAFGEVFRAWDGRLDRQVALKLLPPDEPAAEASTVILEASRLARVRHPNVVTVYGADRSEGRVGLWMELISGRTLDTVLREQGRFGPHEASVIGRSLCAALSAVHRAGLLHRDVKAQNVMREDGGRIVLMDFGTGAPLADAPGQRAAGTAGTPLYLAPELFAGEEATVQSDIYSVGVLLFHLATTSFPVRAASLDDLRAAHAEGSRRFLRDERPDLPEEFIAVVERATERERWGRFQTVGALDEALARIVARRPSPRRSPRRGWLLGSLLAGPVLAAAVGWSMRDAPASLMAPATSMTARKVAHPSGLLLGRPSPDGRLFSFSDDEGNLAVLEMGSGRVRRLTTGASLEAGANQHAEYSVISRDGTLVAYTWWALDGRYEMRVVGADGKRARVLLRSAGVDVPRPIEWSGDGTLVLSLLTRTDGTNLLAMVAADGGEVRPILELGPVMPQHLSLSPDGGSVVYDAPPETTESARDIFLVNTDGSGHRALLRHPASDMAPVWTPDGGAIVFASDRSGTMDLWSIRMSGPAPEGQPQIVHRDIGRLTVLGLTDSGRYYYERLKGAVEVYTAAIDEEDASPAPLDNAYSGSNISSIWSPDGRQAAFASRRGLVGFDRGSTTLVVRDVETGRQRGLIPAMKTFLVRSWSPDGRQVLVNGTDARGRAGLHGIDVETGATSPLVLAGRPSSETEIGRGQWMPDGRRILYVSGRQKALLLRDVQRGTDEVALDFRREGIDGIAGGAFGPGFRISPDGRVLAFTAFIPEGDKVAKALRIKTADQPSRELLRVSPAEGAALQDWTPDGEALLFTRRIPPAPLTLWRVSAAGGDPEPLGAPMEGLRDVSLHPDGRRITFTAGWPTVEVWVLENFLPIEPLRPEPR